jgi:hypothetical protein
MSRHPQVIFTYDNKQYQGREVGIGTSEKDNKQDWSVIKHDDLGTIRVDKSNVTYDNEVSEPTTEQEGESFMDQPDYSARVDNEWKGYDAKDGINEPESLDDLIERDKTFDTHKSLKSRYTVSHVKGQHLDDTKIYKLLYSPTDFD